MSEQMFFIFGPQRSGTTLLTAALDAHPDIKCLDHPFSLRVLQNKRYLNDVLDRFPKVGFKASVWQRHHVKLLRQYPGATVFFMKRNKHHVAASMLKYLDENGRTWASKYALKELQPDLDVWKYSDFYYHAYTLIEAYGYDHLVMATLCTYVKDAMADDIFGASQSYLDVVYEQLCDDSENVMSEVLDMLDVEWDDGVLQHHLNPALASDADFDPTRPIEENGNPSWDRLTNYERNRIRSFLTELEGADE